MRQVVTLGDLVDRRIRLARLIEEHGAEMALPELGLRLAASCPRATAADLSRRCCVYYPVLVREP
jgi:hypothetical protein